MNYDFLGRFNKPELFIKEFKYWLVILKEGVVTLGSAIIVLKSNKPNFKDVTSEEMSEFPKVCKWYEETTKNLYGAEKWNYHANMMKEDFVHFHVIPRYSKEINYYGLSWIDEDWPKATSMKKIEIPIDIIEKIVKDMKDMKEYEYTKE